MPVITPGSGLYDIDPRDAGAAAQMLASQQQQAQLQHMQQTGQPPAWAQDTSALKFPNLVQLGMSFMDKKDEPMHQQSKKEEVKEEDDLPPLAMPKVRVRVRQWVRDDWRWSKGMEALRYFEEVQLAPSLLELARKILGGGSRYPARIADDTDCVTEVTAWGTLLVRPRGSGANVALAKRMLYEVLHPSGGSLREDALITPDEMAEAAVRDQSTIAMGEEDDEAGQRFKTGVQRSSHGDLRRVGLGAEDEAKEEQKEQPKSESKEMPLATAEDAKLLGKHLDDLRIASGAIPVLTGKTLKLLGKDKNVRKAMELTRILVETGEWVALTEGFVMSEETKDKRKLFEGPSEQILIKIAEGPATAKIEKHLKSMERAAAADQLKLTSKAVNGKRTLMVDGTKASHERVKLMVKELSEKGESPMLTKALGMARGRTGFSAMSPAPMVANLGRKVSVVTAPGEITAAPVIHKIDDEAPTEMAKTIEKPSFTAGGLGPGPAMRHLPGPKLAVDLGKGTDLFAGLPSADGADASGAGGGAFPPEPPGLAKFPPEPPMSEEDQAAAEIAERVLAAAGIAAQGLHPGAVARAEAVPASMPGITE